MNISPGPSTEMSQTVDFIVSNDNPALFESQPAISPEGALTYTPAVDAFGEANVTVQLHDDGGTAGGGIDTSVPQMFLVTVSPVNDAPISADDSYATSEDTPLTILAPAGVLANDSDVDGDALEAVLDSGPSYGLVTLNVDGSFSYTPDASFSGEDRFVYHATDGALDSAPATVLVTVSPVNDAPISADDSYATSEDTPLTILAPAGVLANDSDVDGDALEAVLDSGPSHGLVTLNLDGSFSYTPDASFSGEDRFVYHATDGALDSAPATVLVTVSPVNDAPISADDSYATSEDTPLTILAPAGVLANDSDVDGDALEAVLDSGPSHGLVTLNLDGSFSYTPDASFSGEDRFVYHATDGALDSAPATVLVTVSPVNDAPISADDSYATSEDTPLTILAPAGVLANDSDVDGDALEAVLDSGPSHGLVTLNLDGSFSYTPDASFSGEDHFVYHATDGALDSAPATVLVTVSPVNDAPISADDSYATSEDTPLTILAAAGVLANDSDVDGDALEAVLDSGPSHGLVTLNVDGSFSYTPDASFSGEDRFVYHATDGALDSAPATVLVTVSPVNDAPISADDSYATDEDTPLTILAAAGVLANDSDVDGDALDGGAGLRVRAMAW